MTVFFAEMAKTLFKENNKSKLANIAGVFLVFNSCDIYDSNEIRIEKHSTQLIWPNIYNTDRIICFLAQPIDCKYIYY